MEKNKFVLGPTFLHICIDSRGADRDEAHGSISGTALEDTYEFHTSQELLLLIDELLNKIGKPQASRETRSGFREDRKKGGEAEVHGEPFCAEPREYHSAEEILEQTGEAETWNVLFRTRYHSSWQGALFDNDGKELGTFESDLELLTLMARS